MEPKEALSKTVLIQVGKNERNPKEEGDYFIITQQGKRGKTITTRERQARWAGDVWWYDVSMFLENEVMVGWYERVPVKDFVAAHKDAMLSDVTKKIKKHQRYYIDIIHYEEGGSTMNRFNDGFSMVELMGMLSFLSNAIAKVFTDSFTLKMPDDINVSSVESPVFPH